MGVLGLWKFLEGCKNRKGELSCSVTSHIDKK